MGVARRPVQPWRLERLRRHWPLLGPLALAGVLNAWALGAVGWGNSYYAAAVRSMSESWHAFVYGAFDRNGFVTVDKPPLSLWVQTLVVKVFGYHQMSLLVPQVLAGCAAVALVYLTVVRRWGRLAATVGATALAVSPINVMVNHSNNTDAILTLTMTAAVWAGVRAAETGRARWLLGAALAFGASFTTKMLAAFPVLPAVLVAFALAAPVVWRRRAPLLAGGAALAVVSALAWFAFVDLTPESQRPYVGSSPTNSAFQLAFDRNGLGQVEGGNASGGAGPRVPQPDQPPAGDRTPQPGGQAPRPGGQTPPAGGPVGPPDGPGPVVRPRGQPIPGQQVPGRQVPGQQVPGQQVPGQPIPGQQVPGQSVPGGQIPGPPGRPGGQAGFDGGEPGALRLFNADLGTQIGWTIVPAVLGVLAVVAGLGLRRTLRTPSVVAPAIWFAVGAAGYSVTKGIVHPYYVASIAPPLALLLGAAVGVLGRRPDRRPWWILAGVAVAISGAIQWMISRRTGYGVTTTLAVGVTVAGVALAIWALATHRPPRRVLAAAVGAAVLVVPTVWTLGSLKAGVNGSIPYADPTLAVRPGAPGTPTTPGADDLVEFLQANRGDTEWLVAVPSAMLAAPIIIETGDAVMAMGGFSGGDPILTTAEFDELVEAGDLRFVLLGGSGGQQVQGANSPVATHVRRTCERVDRADADLYDCAPPV